MNKLLFAIMVAAMIAVAATNLILAGMLIELLTK